jgi:hypothetical protein
MGNKVAQRKKVLDDLFELEWVLVKLLQEPLLDPVRRELIRRELHDLRLAREIIITEEADEKSLTQLLKLKSELETVIKRELK